MEGTCSIVFGAFLGYGTSSVFRLRDETQIEFHVILNDSGARSIGRAFLFTPPPLFQQGIHKSKHRPLIGPGGCASWRS